MRSGGSLRPSRPRGYRRSGLHSELSVPDRVLSGALSCPARVVHRCESGSGAHTGARRRRGSGDFGPRCPPAPSRSRGMPLAWVEPGASIMSVLRRSDRRVRALTPGDPLYVAGRRRRAHRPAPSWHCDEVVVDEGGAAAARPPDLHRHVIIDAGAWAGNTLDCPCLLFLRNYRALFFAILPPILFALSAVSLTNPAQ